MGAPSRKAGRLRTSGLLLLLGVFMSLDDIERIAKRYKTLMAFRMLEAIKAKRGG